MKKMPAFAKINEAEVATTTTTTPPATSKKPQPAFDAHEVLDFYKSHSEEIKSVIRTMKGTDRTQQMFMLGYYIGYTKR